MKIINKKKEKKKEEKKKDNDKVSYVFQKRQTMNFKLLRYGVGIYFTFTANVSPYQEVIIRLQSK